MADVVRDAIAAELALLTRVVPIPTGALGYGSDLACADDLTDTMIERPGSDPLVLAEALYRRLDCPRGALPDDRDYGLDVRAWLSQGMTTIELRAIAGQVRAEMLRDDRVSACTVTATLSSTGGELDLSIRVVPADPAVAPFTLVLVASSAAVLISEIRR